MPSPKVFDRDGRPVRLLEDFFEGIFFYGNWIVEENSGIASIRERRHRPRGITPPRHQVFLVVGQPRVFPPQLPCGRLFRSAPPVPALHLRSQR